MPSPPFRDARSPIWSGRRRCRQTSANTARANRSDFGRVSFRLGHSLSQLPPATPRYVYTMPWLALLVAHYVSRSRRWMCGRPSGGALMLVSCSQTASASLSRMLRLLLSPSPRSPPPSILPQNDPGQSRHFQPSLCLRRRRISSLANLRKARQRRGSAASYPPIQVCRRNSKLTQPRFLHVILRHLRRSSRHRATRRSGQHPLPRHLLPATEAHHRSRLQCVP